MLKITGQKLDCISIGMERNKNMHAKQVDNLLRFSDDERLEYFIRYCSDFEKIWGLSVGKDNWIVFKNSDGDEIFPVWPHHDLAEYCCFEEHKEMGASPQSILFKDFIEKCIPDMLEQNILFGVFFNLNRAAEIVNPNILKKKLEEEHESLWG